MSDVTTKLKITLKKSPIAAQPNHKECVRGLGLRRIQHSVVLENSECVRGMIAKVNHLLLVEEV